MYVARFILMFLRYFSGTTSRLPVVVCEIDCMGEENRLSECKITSCDTMYIFQAICTKENIVGIQCCEYIHQSLYHMFIYVLH